MSRRCQSGPAKAGAGRVRRRADLTVSLSMRLSPLHSQLRGAALGLDSFPAVPLDGSRAGLCRRAKHVLHRALG